MDSLAFRSHSSAPYTNTNKIGLNLRAVALGHSQKLTEISNYNRFHAKSSLVCCCSSSAKYEVQEGPSCIFVGPLETATKDMLEALYHQARDSYYSGRPLILDDMFDKVELKLRWYGSRSVVKYPRCSLKRQSTYADAEVDHSQTLALASIWASLLVFGIIALVAPPVCTVSVIYQDAVHMQLTPHSSMLASKSLTAANGILAIVLSSSIGYPITVSAGRALQGLWRNDLVALKGSCPGCGEEVFAFVRADESVRPRHKTECHVCERPLVFHAKVENSMSNPGSRWVHGRVYLVARLKDLGPQGSQ
ncbi:hypothetical protein SUGI_0016770 [Cryptomeria japonica]|nr:hypothetical protein SUGI_0016770 [Cryptomeria japonica]